MIEEAVVVKLLYAACRYSGTVRQIKTCTARVYSGLSRTPRYLYALSLVVCLLLSIYIQASALTLMRSEVWHRETGQCPAG